MFTFQYIKGNYGEAKDATEVHRRDQTSTKMFREHFMEEATSKLRPSD